MWLKARDALGLSTRSKLDATTVRIADVTRTNVGGLSQDAQFEQVVNHIRRSHDNTYIVVDDRQSVVGMIRYDLLSDTFFDSSIDTLVRAEDLATPAGILIYPDSSISEAVEAFRVNGDDVLAVVSRDEQRRFLGVVRRSDLTELAIRIRG